MFLERDSSSSGFTPHDVAALDTVLAIVLSALKRHHGPVALLSPPDKDNLTHRKVQSSIENCSLLRRSIGTARDVPHRRFFTLSLRQFRSQSESP